jgi:hypothetical protein
MTKKNDPVSVVTCVLKLGMGAALTLCLVQCSAEQDSDQSNTEPIASVESGVITNPHCGSVTCSSTTDCITVANWPLCAKTLSAQCHTVSHECTYQIKTDPACPCLERDVRHCNINATTGGVQICVANAGRTATYWDTCQATPVCVP